MAGKLTFGSPQGTFVQLSATGGNNLIFSSTSDGTCIQSVQIGNNLYGSSGGTTAFNVTLPPNGEFYLSIVTADDYNSSANPILSFFMATINGQTVKCGSGTSNLGGSYEYVDLSNNQGICVQLTGISYGDQVNSLEFSIV